MNIGFYHNVLANLVTCRRDAVVGREAGVVADEHPMSLGLGSNFEVSEGSSGCLGGSFGASGGPGSIRGLRERLQGGLGAVSGASLGAPKSLLLGGEYVTSLGDF